MAVGAAERQSRAGEQTLQGLFGTHLSIDRRCIEAVRRFIGINDADAGYPAEITQCLGQRFGGQRETELRTRLTAARLCRQRQAKRQQRRCRKAQRRHTQPLFDRTRFCPGLHDS
ncbi:hypothetical protein D3C72_810780 [compost metagenome]